MLNLVTKMIPLNIFLFSSSVIIMQAVLGVSFCIEKYYICQSVLCCYCCEKHWIYTHIWQNQSENCRVLQHRRWLLNQRRPLDQRSSGRIPSQIRAMETRLPRDLPEWDIFNDGDSTFVLITFWKYNSALFMWTH